MDFSQENNTRKLFLSQFYNTKIIYVTLSQSVDPVSPIVHYFLILGPFPYLIIVIAVLLLLLLALLPPNPGHGTGGRCYHGVTPSLEEKYVRYVHYLV